MDGSVSSAPTPAPKLAKLETLQLPPPDVLREIAAKQETRAKEIRAARAAKGKEFTTRDQEREVAAACIQRNYRGYRDRRALKGRGLDPSTRWMEVCATILPVGLQGVN